MKTLEGGCQVPIGVNAVFKQGCITLRAILGLPSGEEILEDSIESKVESVEDCQNLGRALALKFIALGAKDILIRAQNWEF